MDQMLTRSTYQQPTLTQMDFVKKPAAKVISRIPSGWQWTEDPATGDPVYVNTATGHVVYNFNGMLKRVVRKIKTSQAVTPIASQSVILVLEDAVPDRAVSSHVYSTPPRFEDGTLSHPIQLDEDELSEALSDLTNTQLYPKRRPNPEKRRKWVFEPVESQDDAANKSAIVGEERWGTDNDTVASPNLLDDC
jgi:hypothetical protein